MNKPKLSVSSDQLAQEIIGAMQEKKALDITLIDLKEIGSAVTDYFVICSASSFTQIDAVADSVQKEMSVNHDLAPLYHERQQHQEWVVLDYFDVVVHVFSPEKREFYDLEKLWGDGKLTKIKNLD